MIALLLALAMVWPPISDWGPGGTINGATSPTYSLPITVLDSIRVTVPSGEPRQTWTHLRNEALAEWGLPFEVRAAPFLPVTDPGWFPPTDTIAFVRAEVYFGQGSIQTGVWLEPSQSGVSVHSLDPGWRKWPGLWRSFIAHEVGHALGFGHPYPDDFTGMAPGRWVMGSAYHVSDEERAVARAYYA